MIITQNKEKSRINYTLVDVSPAIISTMKKEKHKVITQQSNWPQSSVSHKIVIKPGDTIRITVFESDTNGLFLQENTMRPGNFVSLPQLYVEDNGEIFIPYIGSFKIADMTPKEASKKIATLLENKAIEPNIIIEFINRNGYQVSVLGDVNNAGKFQIDHEREKVLDLISKAGGTRFLGFESYVTLQRNGLEYTALLDDLIKDARKNLYVEPDDIIYVYRQPKMFQVYGAVLQRGMHEFTKREFSISEAIGLAGGLNDNLADPAEVFIFRQIPNTLYKRFLDVNRKEIQKTDNNNYNSVIYNLDLNRADGFFLAQNFPVYENDIIYIANAETAEFRKFLNILGSAALVSAASQNATNLQE